MQIFKSAISRYFPQSGNTSEASTSLPASVPEVTSIDKARDHISTLNFNDALQAFRYKQRLTDLVETGNYAESSSSMLKEAIEMTLSHLPALHLDAPEQASQYVAEHFKTAEERGDLSLLLADSTVQAALGKPTCDLLNQQTTGLHFSSLKKARAHIVSLNFKDVLHAASYRNDLEDMISQGKYDQQAYDILDEAMSAEAPTLPEIKFKDDQEALSYIRKHFNTDNATEVLSLVLGDPDVKQHLDSHSYMGLGSALHQIYDPSVMKYKQNEDVAIEIFRSKGFGILASMRLLNSGEFDPITEPENRARLEKTIDLIMGNNRVNPVHPQALRPVDDRIEDRMIGQRDLDDFQARLPRQLINPVIHIEEIPLQNLDLGHAAIGEDAVEALRGLNLQGVNLRNHAEDNER